MESEFKDPRLPRPESLAKRSATAQCLIHARVIDANLTQQEVADRAGINRDNLAMWEVRAPISANSWRKLREVLPTLPAEWAFTYPAIIEQYTGQKSAPPRGTTVEELDAERAKIEAIVLIPDDADGYYTR